MSGKEKQANAGATAPASVRRPAWMKSYEARIKFRCLADCRLCGANIDASFYQSRFWYRRDLWPNRGDLAAQAKTVGGDICRFCFDQVLYRQQRRMGRSRIQFGYEDITSEHVVDFTADVLAGRAKVNKGLGWSHIRPKIKDGGRHHPALGMKITEIEVDDPDCPGEKCWRKIYTSNAAGP